VSAVLGGFMRRIRSTIAISLGALLALGGAAVLTSPAHAADVEVPVWDLDDLNDAIAEANLGKSVIATLMDHIDVDGAQLIDVLEAGELELDGRDHVVTIDSAAVSPAGFKVVDTATFTARDLVVDVLSADHAAFELDGEVNDPAASPVVRLYDIEITMPQTPGVESAIVAQHVQLEIEGLTVQGGDIGVALESSFGQDSIIRAGEFTDQVNCGVQLYTSYDAQVRLEGIEVSGAECAGIQLVAYDHSSIGLYGAWVRDSFIGLELVTQEAGRIELDGVTVEGSEETAVYAEAWAGTIQFWNATLADNDVDFAVLDVVADCILVDTDLPCGSVYLENSTISGNTLAGAPTVVVTGHRDSGFITRNTIVAGNAGIGPAGESDFHVEPVGGEIPMLEMQYDFVGYVDATEEPDVLAALEADDNVYSTDAALDPELAALAVTGATFIPTMLPTMSSPVVNAGDPDYGMQLLFDARDRPRVSGPALDIGAVEAQYPSAPVDLVAEPEDGAMSLAWSAPDDAGDATEVDEYRVEYRADGESDYQVGATTASTSATISGLTNGTEYEFRVAASNGYPDWPTDSATAYATPVGPNPPTPALAVDPSTARIGATVDVTGTGFPADSTVELRLSPMSSPIALAASDADGEFSAQLTIPPEAEAGDHTLSALVDGDVLATATITVQRPTLHLSSQRGAPGDQLLLRGSDFAPGDELQLHLHSTPVLLGTVTADDDGAFEFRLTIPEDAEPGDHTITAQLDGTVLASTTLTVTRPAHPSTGYDPTGTIVAGTLLLVAGLGVILLARRSRV